MLRKLNILKNKKELSGQWKELIIKVGAKILQLLILRAWHYFSED
jgi:hypothetical protein